MESKVGGMGLSEAPRLRQLEEENRQLKQTMAECCSDKRASQAVAVLPVSLLDPQSGIASVELNLGPVLWNGTP